MANYEIKLLGMKEFELALARNPLLIKTELKLFIQRALAKYTEGILRNPWAVGATGGGSPVLTGNLRDTHVTEIGNFEGRIYPNTNKAPYALFVHEGTGKMKARPWLDYVKKSKNSEILELEKQMMDKLIKDLSR